MTQQPITIAHSAVNARLVNATQQDKLIVQNLLSYSIEMRPGSSWDGRQSFFDYDSATFPAGFVVMVQSALVKAGRKVNVVRRPFPAPLGPLKPVVDAFPEDPRYSYQPEIVERLLKYGQIIAQVATGGGKSRVAKLTFGRIRRKTLFLTTRAILMHQMRKAFVKDMGVDVAIYGDGAWHDGPDCLMNVGMVQTFAARLEKKTVQGEIRSVVERRLTAEQKEVDKMRKARVAAGEKLTPEAFELYRVQLVDAIRRTYPSQEDDIADITRKVEEHNARRLETIELLKTFEVVILEEAHEVSGNGFFDTMSHCTSAHYRLALTATPFMKDSEEANLRLMAVSGPVGIKITEKMLIDLGILAKPYFKYIDVPLTKGLYRSTPYQKAYEVGIVKCPIRNGRIVSEVARGVKHGLTAMVLVLHKEHGQELARLFTEAGIRCNFIRGEHNQSEREAALAALAAGDIDVLIGSTILDVGVDVPAVGMVVLAGAGKAEVALRQRIGRGARAKKKGKNVFFVIDFTDVHNNHLRAHARERRAIVEGTPGFVEGIVPDFPLQELGFLPMAA